MPTTRPRSRRAGSACWRWRTWWSPAMAPVPRQRGGRIGILIRVSTDARVDRLEHSEQWRVRTFELDSNGHVNNAVYLNYAEVVATEHALGYGRAWTEQHQIGWAAREHRVVYHRPAGYRDLLRVTTESAPWAGSAPYTPRSAESRTGSCSPRWKPPGSASAGPTSARPASRRPARPIRRPPRHRDR